MRLIEWTLFVVLVGALGCAAAASDPVSTALRQADEIERQLATPVVSMAAIESVDSRLQTFDQIARKCLVDQADRLKGVTQELGLLGKPVPKESAAVGKARDALSAKQSSAEQMQADCRLLLVRMQELRARVRDRKDSALTQSLLARGPGLPALHELSDQLRKITGRVWQYWQTKNWGWRRAGLAGFALLAALLVAGWVIARNLARRTDQIVRTRDCTGFSANLFCTMAAATAHYLPPITAASIWVGFWALSEARGVSDSQMMGLGVAVFAWLLIALLIRGLFENQTPADEAEADRSSGERLGRRLRVLALTTTVFGAILWVSRGVELTPVETVLVGTSVLVVLGAGIVPVLLALAQCLKRRWRALAGTVLIVIVLVAVGAGLLGYLTLGVFILKGLLLSVLTVGIGHLLMRVLADFFDGLDEGRRPWQLALRGRLGAGNSTTLPGSLWLRLFAEVLVWVAVGVALLSVWQVPVDRAHLAEWITGGFQIAGLQVVPARIVLAFVVLGLLLSLVAAVKRRLETRWLLRARVAEGARNSFVTLTGYFGSALAIVTGLSVAGLDLSNLALIAGALSVGIGFGLQNVVNNFVSGLILLFERPIRLGDWVLVGGAEGRVHRISIRSTQIRTFDRADVVVPNSDLISGQVTNWTLRDPIGRVRAPVGVSYDTDLEEARNILLDLAAAHRLVIADGDPASAPSVLFLGFGDSALNLELRFFVRDVNQRLNVLSEINFAIVAAFRAAGIEIPYPQRDLHWRSGYAATPGIDSRQNAMRSDS